MSYSETASRILDTAERVARKGGYNAFSFREIANEIGIKSSSVHYHFPTKEALGAALADRYTDRFLAGLGAPEEAAPNDMLVRYIAACAHALKVDGLMCLCGMFGAEIAQLPSPVACKTRTFFVRNLEWLEQVYGAAGQSKTQARQSAARMIATVEGALILARAMEDDSLFDSVTANLI